jgi:hypothetical protein
MDFRDATPGFALAGIPFVYLPGSRRLKVNGVESASVLQSTLSLDDVIKAMKDIEPAARLLQAISSPRVLMPRPAQGSSGPSPDACAAMQKQTTCTMAGRFHGSLQAGTQELMMQV